METVSSSRSSRLFLIELICAVLFFSLGSAVCVQAFVQAHTVSTRARDLSFASAAVSSAANVLRYAEDPEDFLTYYPEAGLDSDGTVFLCYGADLTPCDEDSAAYVLRAEARVRGGAHRARIGMYNAAGEEIYALELCWPAPGEEAAP